MVRERGWGTSRLDVLWSVAHRISKWKYPAGNRGWVWMSGPRAGRRWTLLKCRICMGRVSTILDGRIAAVHAYVE